MTYNRLPLDLANTLRAEGLKVVETPGWKTRGRPSSTGGFAPVGVLCHHTATSKRSSLSAVLRLLISGRSDLPGPLCQLGLDRDGTVYLIASGRANHGGFAKASGTVATGDGNELYIGIEAFNDGVGEPWPAVQYNAYVLLCAVLSAKVTKNSANTVRAHKETSVTGKIDPRFDMSNFRTKVAVQIDELDDPAVPVVSYTRGTGVDHAIGDLIEAETKATKSSPRLQRIQAALAALRLIPRAKVIKTH